MNCFTCDGTMEQSTTTFTVDLEHTLIVIRHVPCETCNVCGESYFSDEISDELDTLVEKATESNEEICLWDFALGSGMLGGIPGGIEILTHEVLETRAIDWALGTISSSHGQGYFPFNPISTLLSTVTEPPMASPFLSSQKTSKNP